MRDRQTPAANESIRDRPVAQPCESAELPRNWQCLLEGAIMRRTVRWLVLLTCVTTSASTISPVLAASHKRPRSGMREVPAYYVDALQTAGQFLAAWRSGDLRAGEGLLSDRLARATPDKEWIRQFFTGLSTPYHAAFAIHDAMQCGREKCAFRVVLYESSGEQGYAYPGKLELLFAGGQWRIDNFPFSSAS